MRDALVRALAVRRRRAAGHEMQRREARRREDDERSQSQCQANAISTRCAARSARTSPRWRKFSPRFAPSSPMIASLPPPNRRRSRLPPPPGRRSSIPRTRRRRARRRTPPPPTRAPKVVWRQPEAEPVAVAAPPRPEPAAEEEPLHFRPDRSGRFGRVRRAVGESGAAERRTRREHDARNSAPDAQDLARRESAEHGRAARVAPKFSAWRAADAERRRSRRRGSRPKVRV